MGLERLTDNEHAWNFRQWSRCPESLQLALRCPNNQDRIATTVKKDGTMDWQMSLQPPRSFSQGHTPFKNYQPCSFPFLVNCYNRSFPFSVCYVKAKTLRKSQSPRLWIAIFNEPTTATDKMANLRHLLEQLSCRQISFAYEKLHVPSCSEVATTPKQNVKVWRILALTVTNYMSKHHESFARPPMETCCHHSISVHQASDRIWAVTNPLLPAKFISKPNCQP